MNPDLIRDEQNGPAEALREQAPAGTTETVGAEAGPVRAETRRIPSSPIPQKKPIAFLSYETSMFLVCR